MPSRRKVSAMEFNPPLRRSQPSGHKFPTFPDGDVKIIITGSRQYQLHKSILKNSSPLFQELLSDENTATLSSARAKLQDLVVTNMLRATTYKSEKDGKLAVTLKAVKLDNEGCPISMEEIGLDLENGMVVPAVYTAFDKVLGAFYHRPINLNEVGNGELKDFLPNVVEVLKVAEYLQCVPMFTQHFEATLLSMGDILYHSISVSPVVWLNLSIRMQSKTLYRECMMHAAARYNTPELREARSTLDPLTRDLMRIMAAKIAKDVKTAISLMLSYYPVMLQRPKSTSLLDKGENMRNSYANDILQWMALTIFRQWLSHQVAEDRTHHASDLGYATMRLIDKGGRAYLTKVEVQAWHEFFPLSTKSSNLIQERLEGIKNYVQRWTQKVFRNNTRLDYEEHGIKYFPSAEFVGDKYPWDPKLKKGEGDDSEDDEDDEASDSSEEPGDIDSADEDKPATSAKSVTMADAPKSAVQLLHEEVRRASKRKYGDTEFEDELTQMDTKYKARKGAGLPNPAPKEQPDGDAMEIEKAELSFQGTTHINQVFPGLTAENDRRIE